MTTSELGALLDILGRMAFVEHVFQESRRGAPEVVTWVRDWGGTADVLILLDEEHALAYRTATGSGIDVFDPPLVSWSYSASPVWTVRALIVLPQPGHPSEPTTLEAPRWGDVLPKEARTFETVRIRRRW